MKKFAKILICLILCVFAFGLVACGKKDSFVYPTASEITYSNGGLAVRKGDYLYFVNGYKSASSIDDDNVPNSFFVGSLMIAKLDGNGNLIKDENGVLKDEYYRTMSDKLCGFEATNLFIFGDYLYFASPCLREESADGPLAKERVVFNRIKLDNSSKVEEIYESHTTNSNLEYNFYNANNQTYLLVFEKGKSLDDDTNNRLVRINVGGKKIGKEETVEKDISLSSSDDSDKTAVILPKNNAYTNVFFAKANTKDDKTSYVLYRYNAITNQKDEYCTRDAEFSLKFVGNTHVFITENGEYSTSSVNLYKSNFNEESKSFTKCWGNVQNYNQDSLTIAVDGETIFLQKDNSIYSNNNPTSPLIQEDNTPTILGASNNLLYYYVTNDNNERIIKSLSYLQANTNDKENLTVTIATLSDSDLANFEIFEGKYGYYLFFFKNVGNNQYLHSLLLSNNLNNEKEELVGVLLEEDVPKTDDSTSEE